MPRFSLACLLAALVLFFANRAAASEPTRAAQGMVVAQERIAASIGAATLRQGGSAVDAAVATAFALAVTHPAAGNIGGGGFLVYRHHDGTAVTYDFRERAPKAATTGMWVKDGEYDARRHHESHLAVGVPGTVAGLRLAWEKHGKLPWPDLLAPAIRLARGGFVVSPSLSLSLKETLHRFQPYPASIAQFTKEGEPYTAGERLRQPDLADSLRRISRQGVAGFYQGKTAELIVDEMRRNGGIITHEDLAAYTAKSRAPIRGEYRGYEVLSMPPPSSGGVALVQMLNILEGYDLREAGFQSAAWFHLTSEAMRRAYRDRARHLGDPDFNPEMPLSRLVSKEYATELRRTIDPEKATPSSPADVRPPPESEETTHLSVVDAERNAVSLTYTLEYSYGSAIVVQGGGFLLNNEMGDFNPVPGSTTESGLIGTPANLTAPGKRMLSSMTPTILARDGEVFMVTGSPGGRTIINTVLQTIVNVIDFGMNAQEAVDAKRFHHQWLPNTLYHENYAIPPDAAALLRKRGHALAERGPQGAAQVILWRSQDGVLEGGCDPRAVDGTAAGY